MITSLALLWLAGTRQGIQHKVGDYFSVSTGANGLEDYAYALELLEKGYWTAYTDWPAKNVISIPQRFTDPTQAPPDPKLIELQQRLSDFNLLQVRRDEIAAFQRSLTLVSSGNDKPCDFTKVNEDSRLPTAPIVSALGKLERDSAYVAASESRTDKAIEDLISSLVLADHLCRTTYIGGIIITLNLVKVCSEFGNLLDRFSVQDAKRVEELVNSLLGQPPSFLDAYRASMLTRVDDVAKSIRALKASGNDTTNDKTLASFQQVINTMSDSDVNAMIQRVQRSIEDDGQIFLSRFSGPEETWLPQDAPQDNGDPDPVIRTPSDVEAYYVSHWALPEVTKPRRLVEALRSRAMLRLLRLHALIIEFRWEQERLPKTLDEIGLPSVYEFDPLSNRLFIYNLTADGYELYSKGSKLSGRVDLGGGYNGPLQPNVIAP